MSEVRGSRRGFCPEHVGLLDQLDDLRSKLIRLTRSGEVSGGGGWEAWNLDFLGFSRDLQDHMSAEETNFFPIVEWAVGEAESPTRFILDEHREVRRILQELDRGITLSLEAPEDLFWPYCGRLGELLGSLASILRSHISGEDRLFFPLGQHVLRRRLSDEAEQVQ